MVEGPTLVEGPALVEGPTLVEGPALVEGPTLCDLLPHYTGCTVSCVFKIVSIYFSVGQNV